MMNRQQTENERKMNEMMEMLRIQKQKETRIKCPKWEKEENIKNFLSRLQRWDEIETGRGKYLLLLESLQTSGRNKEKLRVELEVQNNKLDPENENIITNVIKKLKHWFGKTKIDEASEAWEKFVDIKRNNEEHIDSFLLRFETIESQLISSAVPIPNTILSLQLLKSVNVSGDQRQNILLNVSLDNTDTVYDEMKTSIRLLKGNLLESKKEPKTVYDEEEEINYSKMIDLEDKVPGQKVDRVLEIDHLRNRKMKGKEQQVGTEEEVRKEDFTMVEVLTEIEVTAEVKEKEKKITLVRTEEETR